jgi:hypothetical protein
MRLGELQIDKAVAAAGEAVAAGLAMGLAGEKVLAIGMMAFMAISSELSFVRMHLCAPPTRTSGTSE